MTTWPELRVGRHLVTGLIAIAIFGVFTYVILNAEFAEAAGFPAGESVTGNIGLALLNIPTSIPTEGFLVALILVAFVLDAALDGAVLLAKREEEGRMVTALDSGGDDDE